MTDKENLDLGSIMREGSIVEFSAAVNDDKTKIRIAMDNNYILLKKSQVQEFALSLMHMVTSMKDEP